MFHVFQQGAAIASHSPNLGLIFLHFLSHCVFALIVLGPVYMPVDSGTLR